MKAIWKDTVIAQSDETVIIEGNHYFPPDSIKDEFFKDSAQHSVCVWKGTASYYDDRAKRIEGYVAFWRGIRVTP